MNKCVIIGAGPAGMSAALYLKRAGIEPIIIEKGIPGGEMLKTNKIENYLGFSEIDGGELSLKMLNQIKELGVEIIKDEVKKVSFKDKFLIDLNDKTLQADFVIVATGRKPRKLGLNNEDKLINRGISYCAVCDGAFYRGKEVAVVGGGDSAFTEALYLSDLCKKVYVLVRKEIRANESLVNKVKNKENIVILKKVNVSEFKCDDRLLGVVLDNGATISAEGVFIAIGGIPQFDFLSDFDITLENGYIKTDEKMETNVKGLYAIGDVRFKDFYQIITAVNDGVVAALSIREEV